MRAAPDGSWLIDLNTEVLPRVLVNQTYRARVTRGASDADRSFVANCLQTANWLTKSLEQRARTILKVSERDRAPAGTPSSPTASSTCAR